MDQILGSGMLPFLLLFVVLYFFMIRPQLKRQKMERKFQTDIKKGSKVVMTSGIHGKVVETNETEGTVLIETQAGRIKFEKSAISMEMSKRFLKTADKK
ncbi:MAG TPA: preprotein translocase subunit YajC [Lutibacter sp.]|nr:preprotein translocase subunit YajC [Lutibacter sp.]